MLKTDISAGHTGHGLTFTIGRSNARCVAATNALKYMIVGRTLESFTANLGAFWHTLTRNSQAQIE